MKQTITPETNINDLKEMFVSFGYECSDLNDEGLLLKARNINVRVSITNGKNIMFLSSFILKADIPLIDALTKANEINYALPSGNIAYKDGHFLFCFSLIRPFGMGIKGLESFINYHLGLLPYIIEHHNLAEMTK
ncbi:hypothetical protein [Citrobacter youngae]|uniref:hypothetical protein n=1 Tax=Citrobacter youngae TaxID=133448 RepID=UPI003978B294